MWKGSFILFLMMFGNIVLPYCFVWLFDTCEYNLIFLFFISLGLIVWDIKDVQEWK